MWISILRPPPSWILSAMGFDGQNYSGTSFSDSVSNLVRIRSKMAELQPFNWFQDGGRPPSWIFANVNFDDKSGSGTLFSASVSNSVKICSILTKRWPKMWIPILQPPPSWTMSLGYGFSTVKIVPEIRGLIFSLCQIWCESVQKWWSYGHLTVFKMAAAAIFNLLRCLFLSFDSHLCSGYGRSRKIS